MAPSMRPELEDVVPAYICQTCGVQYAPSERPPERCPICEDERQYVGWGGQRWVTMDDLVAEGRRNVFREEEPNLTSIGTEPPIAIGQRALLVRTPNGNVLFDCLTLLDDATIVEVKRLGGLAAIALSHPHFYASMSTWSTAFDDCPIYIHAADHEWVQYPSPAVTFWEGISAEILPGVTLLNPGGHFEGSQVLHWAAGAEGRGVLLSGDTVAVVMDRRYVSFMYSYPNLIPLGERAIRRILETLRMHRFERIYGGWNGRVVAVEGSDAVERSAERYLRQLADRGP
jgi:glyoxylase-like metal-dependent hydrolase (beta-lactamase superfamily II)